MQDILTVNELFSGIGAQRKALLRLNIPHEVVGVCEIDKYAIQSYEAIFGETRNYGDICTTPRLDYADLWTYSFPCQDISVAGNQKGINENTRSGLLYQVQRLLEVAKEEGTLPKYLLLENVKNLVGKKFKSQFDDWLFYLQELGYDNHWQVLNAKNYGIPQNRERVFVVSIRKDLNQTFEFPKAEELTKRLVDVLEAEVDEKFYINNDKARKLLETLVQDNQLKNDIEVVDGCLKEPKAKEISNCIKARYDNGISNLKSDGTMVVESKRLGGLYDDEIKHQAGSVWDTNGLAPTIDTMQGGNRQPCIIQLGNINPSKTGMNGNVFSSEGLSPTITTNKGEGLKILEPCIVASRGRNPENPSDRTVGAPTEQRLEVNSRGVTNTITTVQKDNYVLENRIIQVGNLIKTESFGGNPQRGRVYDPNGISPALNTVGGGGLEPKILKFDIPEIVKIRKQQVDVEKLKCLLREHKKLSIKEIAFRLDKPYTEVAHWFRSDDCFSIPNSDVWFELKKLLNIETEEFDLPITEFIEKEGVYEKSNRCYHEDGIAPTLTTTSANEKIINNLRIRKLTPLECWRLMGFDDEDFAKAKASGVSNSQLYKQAGNSIVVNILEKIFENLYK